MSDDFHQELEQNLDKEETIKQTKKAKFIVYRLLARREYSKQELYNKLSQKEYSDNIINKVIDEFQNNNMQSDYRTAEMLLSHGYKSGWGPNKIRLQMQNKGIADSIIEKIFASINNPQADDQNNGHNIKKPCNLEELQSLVFELESNVDESNNQVVAEISSSTKSLDWFESALQVSIKKFGQELAILINKENNNWQFKAKIQRFLYNKGFEQEHIDYVFKFKDYNI